jgi:integrase
VYDKKQKKHIKFRKDDAGDALTYDKARNKLNSIRTAKDNDDFKIEDLLDKNIKARKIENLLDDWILEKEKEKTADDFSGETLKNYRGYIKNYFLPHFKGLDVREIEAADVTNFKNKLQDYAVKVKHNGRKNKEISDKTRKNIMNGLRTFLGWLHINNFIKTIPAFPIISVNDAEERVAVEYEEQQAALEKIPPEHRDIIEVNFELGLRSGEMCVIKGKDINILKQQAKIRRTRSGAEIVERTKGKHQDLIPLSDRALELIKKHMAGKFPDDYIFKNPDARNKDSIYTQKYLNNLWKKYTGMDVCYYEASRHSFCTQVVDDCGADALQAQILMRHTDVRQTQNYFHGNTKKLREIVNKRGKNKGVIYQDKTVKVTVGKL